MLLSLLGGAMADCLDRRRMMLSAQLFMLLVSMALSICTWQESLTPEALLAFTFLIGSGYAIHHPAYQASVADMVPRSALSAAIGLNSMSFNLARGLGPAMGGAIVATCGIAAAFLVNAMSFLGTIVVLMRWRPDYQPAPVPRETLARAILAGLRYTSSCSLLRRQILRVGLFSLTASATPAMLPLIARDLIGGGSTTYSILLCAFGTGAIAGAALGVRLRERMSPENIVRAATLSFAVGTAVAALSSDLSRSLLGLFVAGTSWVACLSTFSVIAQLSAPRWVVGRLLSIFIMSVFGGMAAGSWLTGVAAAQLGVSTALVAAAGALAATVLLGFAMPLQLEDN
jgi:predicted MFS family arabinose efflux permease